MLQSLLIISAVLLQVCMTQYLVYCPCMGRFGNQAEQFLGSLAFSKSINRTLVLPPFISYSSRSSGVDLIAWDHVFDLKTVSEYHDVVTMDRFMRDLAPVVWPVQQRTSWCYSPRPGDDDQSCNAKHGNPFKPFWDSFSVEFVRSEMYAPLNFNTNPDNVARWRDQYPGSQYPVLAMTGAPASFPVHSDHVSLQSHVQWSEMMKSQAQTWIRRVLGDDNTPYIGIHLR